MDRVNLFLIGVNKAGTSWLYSLLDQHPAVFMAEEKELYFFGETGRDEERPPDLEAYHRHFPFDDNHQYYGDATVMYYRSADVAAQIQRYNPEAKILAIVRDPIDRLQSQYRYHKQIGILEEETTLAAALDGRDPKLVNDSHYEETLPPYEEQFGPGQFMVVSLEQGRSEPEALWSELQEFLDLPPAPFPSLENRPENPTGSSAFRRVYRTLVPPIRRHLPNVYRWMLTSSIVRTGKRGLLRLLGTAEREDLSPELQSRLQAEFAPTYAYLRRLGFSAYDDSE